MKNTEVIQSEERKYKSYQPLVIWYHLTSDWYHFYFHKIYADVTANYEIKLV